MYHLGCMAALNHIEFKVNPEPYMVQGEFRIALYSFYNDLAK